MKQTAVEFLVNEIKKLTGLNISNDEPIIKQAKEIEKQQIEDTYRIGRYENNKIVMSERYYAEYYYNETFKKK